MKNQLILGAAVLALSFTACKKESLTNDSTFGGKATHAADYIASDLPKDTISADINVNTTLTSNKVWVLKGIIGVRNNAILTIQPGTTIVGTVTTDGTNKPGSLVITRGAKINAVGTPQNPIIFTSRNLVDGNTSTVGAPGDFGGVILLGKAASNVKNKLIEGLDPAESFDNKFGCNSTTDLNTTENDNSGSMQYVRIEYAGYNLSPNNEINGLTLGGVGSGTLLDHIQVSYSRDDSFEFFGGSVNASYLISLAGDDDGLDFDNGYTGTISYSLVVCDPYATHSTSGGNSDSNGIESDNNSVSEDATFTILPKTHPKVINSTIVGSRTITGASGLGYKYGAFIRRGSEIEILKSVIMGFKDGVVFDASSDDFFTRPVTSISKVQNSYIQAFTNIARSLDVSSAAVTNEPKIVIQSSQNVNFSIAWANPAGLASNAHLKLTQPFYNVSAPNLNFIPGSTSPLTTQTVASAKEAGALNTVSKNVSTGWRFAEWVKWYL